jgi:hypothetical protein
VLAVSGLLQGGSCAGEVFGTAQEVEIALIAAGRIDTGIDFVGKALKQHEIDSLIRERGGSLVVGLPQSTTTLPILRARRTGDVIARQEQSAMGAVGESEQGASSFF